MTRLARRAYRHRRGLAAAAGLGLALVATAALAARSPFGVGIAETSVPPSGIFAQIAAYQAAFSRALTEALKALKTDPSAGWWLATVSFLYGVFHAAGPGHGKAVISSYVLANGETARRAVLLAFAAAFVQALSALLLVGGAAVALGMTSMAITRATGAFETGSYALIALIGAWLVWRKAVKPFLAAGPVHAAAGAGHAHVHEVSSDCSHGPGCGHSHAPDPAQLGGRMTLARAASVVLAVGMRPCTGALIVLVFALAQGLLWAGVAATFVMALGTALTVAALATLAVFGRGLALRLAGGHSRFGTALHRGIEIGGALLVLVLGVTLTLASLGPV